MAKRKTALQLAQEEIDRLRSLNNGYQESHERMAQDAARARSDLSSEKLLSSAREQNARQQTRDLFNTVFRLHCDVARKEGYIERVREIDNKNGAAIEAPVDMAFQDFVNQERDNLATARTDLDIDRVLDGMPPDVLDAVLGRDIG